MRPIALPGWGPVRVAVTGSGRSPGDLVVNDTPLSPVTGDLLDVVTYRSDGLLAVPEGKHGPLALSLDPGTSDFTVLAVHSSSAGDRPAADLSGVLDQVQTPPSDLVVTVDVAGSVEIGDGVEVPVEVHNDSDIDLADVLVTFVLPPGVLVTVPRELSCSDVGSDLRLTCDVGPLEAGRSRVVPLTLTVPDGLVLSEEVAYTVTGTDPVTGAPVGVSGGFVVTADPGRGVRGTWQGPVAVTEVGAPLMRCAPLTCWIIGSSGWKDASNDHVAMWPLNEAGGVTSSSSATVRIPDGAAVKHAGLYWSANRTVGETFSHDLTSARLRAPGTSAYLPVEGEVLGEVTDSAGRISYQSYADVTDLVAAHGEGEWSVADVALGTRLPGSVWDDLVASRDHYGGWSLVVVYEDVTLATGTVTVLDAPFAVVNGSGLSLDFLADAGRTVSLGAVAWEGDRRVTGDQLQLNSVALRPMLARSTPDHPLFGSAADAFDSTAWGAPARHENTLGVDAKKFETTAAQGGANTISATTTGDEYVMGVLTITIR